MTNSRDCNDYDPNLPRYFSQDSDGDGYGDRAVFGPPPYGCIPPPGYSYNHDDCNDGNRNVHPGATEYCNGVDDNCSGSVDESCVWGAAYFSGPTVPSAGTATFGYTTEHPVSPGARAYLYGTKNGVVEESGSWSHEQTTFSFTVPPASKAMMSGP